MPGQGTIVATGAIGYPAGLRVGAPRGAARAGRGEGHDDDQHLRPPGHPGRRERRVPGGDRPSAARRRRLLRRGARRAWGCPPPRRGPSRRAAPAPAALAPAAPPAPAVAGTVDAELLAGVAAAMSVVKAHRSHGHLAARLDPLGAPPPGDPALAPEQRQPDAGADGADPGVAAAGEGPRRELRRRAAPPARGLLRHDRVRDRAPLRPPEAALAARGGRVGPDARAAGGRAPPGDPASGSSRWTPSSASCGAPTWARRPSRSRAWTRSCRSPTR